MEKESTEKKDQRRDAPDLPPGEMNSEREAEAGGLPDKEKNYTERDRTGPTGEDAGKKPHRLRTTSKSEFEKGVEEREGPIAARAPAQTSLHEELSERRDESDDGKRGKSAENSQDIAPNRDQRRREEK